MTSLRKTAGSTTYYNGLLSRPFLAEHWYRGLVAAILSLFLLTLTVSTLFDQSLLVGAFAAAPFSLLLLVAAVTQHQRFELEAVHQRYRSYLWVLGLRFGKWYPLPSIDFIKIRHWQQWHELPLTDGSTPTLPNINLRTIEDKWQVLLHVTDSPAGLVAAYVDQVKAKRIAVELANLLHIEVRS